LQTFFIAAVRATETDTQYTWSAACI